MIIDKRVIICILIKSVYFYINNLYSYFMFSLIMASKSVSGTEIVMSCMAPGCPIRHSMHYCRVCGDKNSDHYFATCPDGGWGVTRCKVFGCTKTHGSHYCHVCGWKDANHFSSVCPVLFSTK